MEKICQTCGVGGFSRSWIYCTQCWDTVEHIWICDSCKSIGELLAKMIVYGEKQSEVAKFAGCGALRNSDLALPAGGAIPVVGPIWRGACDTSGSFNGSLKGMEAFMPKTSYSNVIKIVGSMQPSLCFHVKERKNVWPKKFDELGAADCNIGLYIFPECARSETDYNNLVEYMISNDLAMIANMANVDLIVFTSLEISAPEKHKIQGKYYFWGTFMEKGRRGNLSKSYMPSEARKRIGRGVRFVSCSEKPSISPQTPLLIQSGAKSKQRAKKAPLRRFYHIPSLRPGCKRARSKRGKARYARPTNDQETVVLQQTFDKPSEAETCTIVEALHCEECLPQVTVAVDEFSVIIPGEQNIVDSFTKDVKCEVSEVNKRSNGPDPEQTVSPLITSVNEESENPEAMSMLNVPRSSRGANPLDTEGPCEEAIPDQPVRQLLLCNKDSDLSPTLRELVSACREDVENSIIDSEVYEPNPLINAESDPCSHNEPVADHQNAIDKKAYDSNIGTTDDGLTQFPPLEDHLETHPEKVLCMTPVLDVDEERPGASTCLSTASTIPLDLNAEQTAISGSENLKESSLMTIPVSILEMTGDYHEASSNCVRTLVGRYHIKADFAPILTKNIEKYGDIALNCSMDPEVPLENICKVIQDLESVGLSGLRHHHVRRLKDVLLLADALGIDIKWLRKRYEDLEKLASHLSRYPTLKKDLTQCKKDIQCKEEKLSLKRAMFEKLQEEIKSMVKEVESLKEYTEKLDFALQSIKSISGSFQGRSVVDGLI